MIELFTPIANAWTVKSYKNFLKKNFKNIIIFN